MTYEPQLDYTDEQFAAVEEQAGAELERIMGIADKAERTTAETTLRDETVAALLARFAEGDEALAQRTVDTALPPLFDYLESQIGGPYLVGGRFGIADIAVAAPFHNLRLAKVAVDGARWPKLADWVAATLERPSFTAAIAAAKS